MESHNPFKWGVFRPFATWTGAREWPLRRVFALSITKDFSSTGIQAFPYSNPGPGNAALMAATNSWMLRIYATGTIKDC